MDQKTFDDLTKGSGAVYLPYTGDQPHWDLKAISVKWGNINNRIRVSVRTAEGEDALGIIAHHHFGDGSEDERIAYMGDPVQFNLGEGSHYSVPADPPDHVYIEGGCTDEVRVGNADIIGFAHTEWQMVFQWVDPGDVPPPSGDYVTRDEFLAAVKSITERIDKLVDQLQGIDA